MIADIQTRQPYNYQADFLISARNKTRIALFWQMRLGKSPTCVWWLMAKIPQPERVLIICPKSVIVSWKQELEKFNQPYIVLSTQNKDIHTALSSMPVWIITNYECLKAQDVPLKDMQWDAVILDESPKIRNHTSLTTHLFTNPDNFPHISEKYPYKTSRTKAGRKQLRAILTGTPAPEGYEDYFYQFKFLFGKMGPYQNLFQYKHDCLESDPYRSNKLIVKSDKLSFISAYLENNSDVLTRSKLNIDLPHIYDKRFVELDEKHRKFYDEFESNWYVDFVKDVMEKGLQDRSLNQLQTMWATVAQNYLHQLSIGFPKAKEAKEYFGKHKLNEVINLLKTDLKDEKVVIWCQYLRDLEVLQQYISEKTDKFAGTIKGGQTTEQLEKTLQKWNSKIWPYIDVILCQMRKASMGTDLSAADTQIFFSRSWSALDNQQATERLVHPEKIKNKNFEGLLTIDIITENTVDEDLHKALIDKKAESNVYKFFLQRTKMKGM